MKTVPDYKKGQIVRFKWPTTKIRLNVLVVIVHRQPDSNIFITDMYDINDVGPVNKIMIEQTTISRNPQIFMSCGNKINYRYLYELSALEEIVANIDKPE